MKPRKPKAQLSEQLTMRQVAILLADTERDPSVVWLDANGDPTPTAIKRAKRRLRVVEQQTGKRVVFGGGRRGQTGGGRCWTTIRALRDAGLLDDHLAMFSEVSDVLHELKETNSALDMRQRSMAKILGAVQRQVGRNAMAIDGLQRTSADTQNTH